MTSRHKQPAILLVTLMGLPLLAHGQCPLTGPNFLVDAYFALEADDPQSPHWKAHRHAGAAAYSTDISNGELTIRKTAPQYWFYFGQRVSAVDLREQKLAFSAELKLDLTPAAGEYRSLRPGGGLTIKALTGGGILWTSQLNHQPRIGTSDWQPVQVVFAVPANAQVLDLGFLHEADGTLQVRKPSLRAVDESEAPCAITPDPTHPSNRPAETPLR